MANKSAPAGLRFTGFFNDKVNNKLAIYHNGTKAWEASGSTISTPGTSAPTTVNATGVVTGGTGLVATAGDIKGTAGNLRLGAIAAFGTTEPTSAVVMKTGTAPVGAITTSGGVFSSSTVVRKIIADGTVSNVET